VDHISDLPSHYLYSSLSGVALLCNKELKLQLYELLAKPSTGVLSLHYYITGEATSTLRRKRYMRKLEKEKGSKNLLKSIYDLGDGLPRVT
jgi:hypothetical protein